MLSGWWLTYPSEKYVSVGIIIPNLWKNKNCSKPPTRFGGQKKPGYFFVRGNSPLTAGFFVHVTI